MDFLAECKFRIVFARRVDINGGRLKKTSIGSRVPEPHCGMPPLEGKAMPDGPFGHECNRGRGDGV